MALQHRNQKLFYRILIDHIEEMMPIVYTPTVGQACLDFGTIFRQTQGFYITAADRGDIRKVLDNWPGKDVRVVVVTDGQRILGLGDLGSNGMGIPIGKLSLYTAAAGVAPEHCLPIMLDVGTNNAELRDAPMYLGTRTERVTGDDYLSLVDEMVEALVDKWPDVLIQFEDFLTPNAYQLLARYRHNYLCFNDDMQGTAAVALSGIIATTRISGVPLADLRILFLGAGSAATGIAGLVTQALVAEGLTEQEARRRLWFVDGTGLVVASRTNLASHKQPYAHEHEFTDFVGAIKDLQPHILIGATGSPGTFTQQVIELMASLNERPAIFALSNPTSLAECTAEQAYTWSGGRAIFASGSPFDPVQLNGRTFSPGQGNNAYVFPGVGLGVLGCRASRITDGMFLAAARSLAMQLTNEQLADGAIYPPLSSIRALSLEIAVAVAEQAYTEGLAQQPRPANLREHIAELVYDPRY